MADIDLGTKTLQSRMDFNDYVEGFNSDDFPRYCAYYAPNIEMIFPTLEDKTFPGFYNWVVSLHQGVTEELVPVKVSVDKDGQYVVAEFHTRFRSKSGFQAITSLEEYGPVVKIVAWYKLDEKGHISRLKVTADLLERAEPGVI
ncbi:hypothetical protein F5884DRAFT_861766 [Xylogone sp. PMI_703]|nr:hypothetical protein F5884DRAFT_861766 [Xylogone sp. PMI_703]